MNLHQSHPRMCHRLIHGEKAVFFRVRFAKEKRMIIFAARLEKDGKAIARSSNGRTTDFGSVCVGSNPARATNRKSTL